MNKLTNQEFIERVNQNTKDKYDLVGNYDGMENPVTLKHIKCGTRFNIKRAGNIVYGGCKCPECFKFEYVDECFPDLAKNFVDQSKTHVTKSSKEIVDLKCPYCESIVKCKVVNYIRIGHVPCVFCCDGFSYPEKFMANVLKQLDIEYEYHYSPSWAKPYIYDFKFKYFDIDYIIETDGGLGHGFSDAYDRTAQETKLIDNKKDFLAKKNGYNIIRVNCNYDGYDRFDYIKNNIIKSLSHILPLNNIDWDECNKFSLKSMFMNVIDIYNTKTKYIREISKLTNVKERTIHKYLTEAMEYGIIPKEILYKEDKLKNIKEKCDIVKITNNHDIGSPIYCYEDVIIFNSIYDACLYYGFNYGSFYSSLQKNNGYYKGRHFVWVSSLQDDFNFERIIFSPQEYCNSGSKKMICQYTLDGDLVHVYMRKEDLPNNMYYANIYRSCTNERESAYGYKWSIMDKEDEFDIFKLIKNNEFARYYICN